MPKWVMPKWVMPGMVQMDRAKARPLSRALGWHTSRAIASPWVMPAQAQQSVPGLGHGLETPIQPSPLI